MLRLLWRNWLAGRVTAAVAARLSPQLQALEARLAALEVPADPPWKQNLHVPPIGLHPVLPGPFMPYSTCSTADLLHPEFARLCGLLGQTPRFHRKLWEWAFILHHGLRPGAAGPGTGAAGPGKRVLGFAVGTEPLPAAFAAAGAQVQATDAPANISLARGWHRTGEYAAGLADLHHPAVLGRDEFLSRVSFTECDMTAIPGHLQGFDFCWSSCALEHLGSLQAGADFVVESVERTLRPGGVACHTTEFNVSSDTDTAAEGETVLYRKSDLLALIERLERRGHKAEPFRLAPDAHVLDFYADTPPYGQSPHLKLRLLGYVTTSAGLVITRGG